MQNEAVTKSTEHNQNDTGLLVWLGAGSRITKAALEKINAFCGRRVLVESRGGSTADLRRKLSTVEPLEILEFPVSDQSASQFLFELNLPEWNALSAPSGLKELYPAIRVTQKRQLNVRGISAVLRELDIPKGSKNYLIIELPDQTLSLFASIEEAGLLNWFSDLSVLCSKFPLYENSDDFPAVQQHLAATGYQISKIDSEDPDVFSVEYSQSPLWHQLMDERQNLHSVSAELQKKDKQIENLQKDLDSARQELHTSKEASEALIKKIEEMQSRLNQVDQRNTGLEKELENKALALSQLEKDNTEIKKKENKLKFQQSKVDRELTKYEAQLELVKDVILREKNF